MTDPEYRLYVSQRYFSGNSLSYFYFLIAESQWTYDAMIIFGTHIFQIIIPFFGVISTLIFHERWTTIFSFEIYKKKSKRSFLYSKAVKCAVGVSLAVFTGYLVYCVFSYVFAGGAVLDSVTRPLFADWFGKEFYRSNTKIYYFLEGVVRFFLIPLFYSFLGIGISLFSEKHKMIVVSPLIYYYFLGLLSLSLNQISTKAYIHLNPAVLMSIGDYSNINTFLILSINALPLLFGIILIELRLVRHDI